MLWEVSVVFPGICMLTSVVFPAAGTGVDKFEEGFGVLTWEVISVVLAAGTGVDEFEVTTVFKVLTWKVGITQSTSN